jgi:hypothetical protein
MALTNPTLPSVIPTWAVPYDSATAFSKAQTVTTSGFVAGNINTQVSILSGRFVGFLVIDVSAANMATADEYYQFALCGSNDAAFTNGNVEILAIHDFAATSALRIIASISSVSPTMPETGKAATRHVIPICNQMGGFIFQYLQLYLKVGGTGPSITFSSWVVYDTAD